MVQLGAAIVILTVAALFVKLYGDRRESRGRDYAAVAHTDSVRLWMARGALATQADADSAVARVVRQRDSLLRLNVQLTARATASEVRARKALDQLHNIPDSILVGVDPRVRATLDSLAASNIDLQNIVSAGAAHIDRLGGLVREDSVAIVRLTHSRDQWKATYDSAAKEIKQLQAMKNPPRCGAKCGGVIGAVATTAVFVLTLFAAHR